jgi:hypothetical protein
MAMSKKCFLLLLRSKRRTNNITFIGVVTTFSRVRLLDEGLQYFECMKSDYGVAPKLEHYACLVDIVGRAGHLDEVHEIIKICHWIPTLMWVGGGLAWGIFFMKRKKSHKSQETKQIERNS